MHDDLEALNKLSDLLDSINSYEQEVREFVFHARRRLYAGQELPVAWREHLGKLLIEIGNIRQFDADSERGAYA
jgi:hypothetical protein